MGIVLLTGHPIQRRSTVVGAHDHDLLNSFANINEASNVSYQKVKKNISQLQIIIHKSVTRMFRLGGA
jgi:hypothetical protein